MSELRSGPGDLLISQPDTRHAIAISISKNVARAVWLAEIAELISTQLHLRSALVELETCFPGHVLPLAQRMIGTKTMKTLRLKRKVTFRRDARKKPDRHT